MNQYLVTRTRHHPVGLVVPWRVMGLGFVWGENNTGIIESKVAEGHSVVSVFGTATADMFTTSVCRTSHLKGVVE